MKTLLIALLAAAASAHAMGVALINSAAPEDERWSQRLTLAANEGRKAAYSITGTVIDQTSQEPIAMAKVTVLGTATAASTNTAGQYTIASIARGIYQIKAEAEGYEPQIKNNVSIGREKNMQPLFFALSKTKDSNPSSANSSAAPPPDFMPVEHMPTPVNKPAPRYPEDARKSGIEGMVWVKLWVDEKGQARDAQVIKSSDGRFNKNAVDAAMLWTFKPAVLNSKPVAVWVTIPFKFRLNENKKSDATQDHPK